MKKKHLFKLLLSISMVFGFSVAVNAKTQGVSDDEIVVGTHTALSGPVAG